MQTKVRANQVSRILSQAGFTKAIWHPSGMIRGAGDWSSGFEAREVAGAVQVSLMSSGRKAREAEGFQERHNQTMQKMAETLEEKGIRITFEQDEDGNIRWMETLEARGW